MQINLIELWHGMGLPVRCVVIVLSLQAIACVAVVIDRLLLLAASAGRARGFAASIQGAMQAGDYEQVLAHIDQQPKPSHLTSYLEIGLRTFWLVAPPVTTHSARPSSRAVRSSARAMPSVAT